MFTSKIPIQWTSNDFSWSHFSSRIHSTLPCSVIDSPSVRLRIMKATITAKATVLLSGLGFRGSKTSAFVNVSITLSWNWFEWIHYKPKFLVGHCAASFIAHAYDGEQQAVGFSSRGSGISYHQVPNPTRIQVSNMNRLSGKSHCFCQTKCLSSTALYCSIRQSP